MPLVASVLIDEIRKFTDEAFPAFVAFPETDADAATAWANAIDIFTGGGASITPPSTTGVLAKTAMQGALLGMSAPSAAPLIFDAAFTLYATTLATGMLPTFVGVPPPLPLSVTPPTILTIFAGGIAGAPADAQAGLMASLIYAWFTTGTATPSGGGPVTPWV